MLTAAPSSQGRSPPAPPPRSTSATVLYTCVEMRMALWPSRWCSSMWIFARSARTATASTASTPSSSKIVEPGHDVARSRAAQRESRPGWPRAAPSSVIRQEAQSARRRFRSRAPRRSRAQRPARHGAAARPSPGGRSWAPPAWRRAQTRTAPGRGHPSRTKKTPVPIGPSSHLCRLAEYVSQPSACRSTGNMPTAWAPSTWLTIARSRASAQSRATG